ncbi:MAG: 30S ribosomal protein S20 [Clostridia bacterium]|nr:30S ribosomal protein S20 [Clostridia bacterium]
MPNIKSAIKRVKVSEKKTLNNSIIRTKYKTAIKKYEAANNEESKDSFELLSAAKKAIDHASSKGVISKNAASRKKSRLEKKLVAKPTTKKAEKETTTKTTTKKTATQKTAVKNTKKATKKED